MWRSHFKGELTFTDNPLSVAFKHPGPDYSVLDHYGHPSIYNIMQLGLNVRLVGMTSCDDRGDCMFDAFELAAKTGSTLFAVATDFQFSRDIYNHSIDFSLLDCKVSLGCVGKGSFTILTEMFVPGRSNFLVRHVKKIVFVDLGSRLPIIIPAWFRERYAGRGSLEGSNFRVEKFERPIQTFFKTSEIRWQDTDLNNHTNFAAYSKLAVSTLHYCFFVRSKLTKRNMNKATMAAIAVALKGESKVEKLTMDFPTGPTAAINDCHCSMHPSLRALSTPSSITNNLLLEERKYWLTSWHAKKPSEHVNKHEYLTKKRNIPSSIAARKTSDSSPLDKCISPYSTIGRTCYDSVLADQSRISKPQREKTAGYGGYLGALGGMSESDVSRGCQLIEVIYLQECVLGDVVVTHLWQGDGSEVKCSIENKAGNPLCQMTIKYFDPSANL